MTPAEPPRSRLQWGLGTLLYGVLLIGLGLGWYQDHQRLKQAKAEQPLEAALYRDQLDDLTPQFDGMYYSWTLHQDFSRGIRERNGHFSWTAEQYLKFLASIPSREFNNVVPWQQQFEVASRYLRDAPDDVYDAVFLQVLAYAKSKHEDTRRGLAIVLREELADPRQRIAPYRQDVLLALLGLLHDDDPNVRYETIQTVAEFGPAAIQTTARLEDLIAEEQNFGAVVAVARIDPRAENIRRVKTWIAERKPGWEFIAAALPKVIPRLQAIAFLRRQYFDTDVESDRKSLASQINLIEIDHLDTAPQEAS
ncbi:hypothetical protein [Blastopirellula marina]|uniref:HEAT repeat domain-containing protein n=1 Tax=Blastopirellula marina TaxID=124 RepID=A0A2S8F4G7_9BACT|nr:hypothetical protein [Blastopirellula marina]PQO27017.1 hypothetical protein C5Y98_27555 [Blastopirellula marina]PTL41164.1 hypothetical protein C5Y97_27570 [Blastopirellula marina]